MSGRRLQSPHGSLLDRSRVVRFDFNGTQYRGFHGDTLASALLANGVQLVARSFKWHRPRGVFSCGIEEPNALVDVGQGARQTPNVRATVLDIYPGLAARSINCWPNVRFDAMAMCGWASRVLPAGFYYKTFKWPNWHWFEPAIRRMAGLGQAPREPDADTYEEISSQVELLVIGGGAAGLAAATAAAESGAQVTLLSSAMRLGGRLTSTGGELLQGLIERARRANVHILLRTMAFGVYDHHLVVARQMLDAAGRGAGPQGLRERLHKFRARHIVLATGAIERPVLFPDNDRPGVMLGDAVEKYAGRYGVACGRRAVIATSCDRAYALASFLRDHGIDVVAIVDWRAGSFIGAEPRDGQNIELLTDARITRVIGRRAVRACEVLAAGRTRRFECDLIVSAGGFAPTVHLHSQAGGRLRWLNDASMFVPDESSCDVSSVGACAGAFTLQAALAHAQEVGTSLAQGKGHAPAPTGDTGLCLASTYFPAKAMQFVDLQNDVTAEDVCLAARENYRSVEHLKRYTTLGMGTDQGKTSNVNALLLMGELTDTVPSLVGTTKFRPPFAPITLGALAGLRVGSRYSPVKRLVHEQWHAANRAHFEEYGGWQRPAAYPLPAESLEDAIWREASTVRRSVGLFDGSPLGKLEVFGPDAGAFLDIMYVGTMSTLKIGQARYGVVLNEQGVVMDDGIVARLDECRFWINTTSAGAERTAAAFEEWLQCEFVGFKVLITRVHSCWVNLTVSGPLAWNWLAEAGFPDALQPNRCKHMSINSLALDGVPLRILRASFSGELSYELNVPVEHSDTVLARLWACGAAFDAVPYGVEALQCLRIEKGYIHIGSDTDGTTLPQDVGLARGIDRKASNFVGRRSLSRPVARDAQRLQLVALRGLDDTSILPVGGQITTANRAAPTEGHVTSSTRSVALGYPIALAMLAGGSSREGERLTVHHLGGSMQAQVVRAPFVDPAGSRLRA